MAWLIFHLLGFPRTPLKKAAPRNPSVRGFYTEFLGATGRRGFRSLGRTRLRLNKKPLPPFRQEPAGSHPDADVNSLTSIALKGHCATQIMQPIHKDGTASG
jgi:hypothetical protein